MITGAHRVAKHVISGPSLFVAAALRDAARSEVFDEIDVRAGELMTTFGHLGIERAGLTGKVVPPDQMASGRKRSPLLLSAAGEDARDRHSVVRGDVKEPAVDGERLARAADEVADSVEIAFVQLDRCPEARGEPARERAIGWRGGEIHGATTAPPLHDLEPGVLGEPAA